MTYNIRQYSKQFEPSFVSLLDRCFHMTNADKIAVVRWKFFHPIYKQKTITYIALNETSDVVSQYTNVPIDLIYASEKIPAMRCLDMATDKHSRGQGLISRLAKAVYTEVEKGGAVCSIGFSNDVGVKVDQHAKNYGYQVVGKMERYITYIAMTRGTTYALKEVDDFIVEIQNNCNYITLNKTISYLRWRYIEKPKNKYKVYQLLQYTKHIGYVILVFDKNKCFVADVVIPSITVEDMKQIVRAIEHEAIKNRTKLVIWYVLHNLFWKKVFWRKLYLKQRYNKHNYYLTVNIHKRDRFYADLLLEKNSWLIFAGDIL